MSDNVRTFCNVIHEKLSSLESRMEMLKLNTGMTWHHLQEKLDEVRARGDGHRQNIDEARAKLEKWFDDNQSELNNTIETWKKQREARKLDERAQQAEDHAVLSIEVAEASIDEAERMILEAISARLDADSAQANNDGEDLSSEVRKSILDQPIPRL
jgi:exonuclease VII large subunit